VSTSSAIHFDSVLGRVVCDFGRERWWKNLRRPPTGEEMVIGELRWRACPEKRVDVAESRCKSGIGGGGAAAGVEVRGAESSGAASSLAVHTAKSGRAQSQESGWFWRGGV
jgi:hypothetical protein